MRGNCWWKEKTLNEDDCLLSRPQSGDSLIGLWAHLAVVSALNWWLKKTTRGYHLFPPNPFAALPLNASKRSQNRSLRRLQKITEKICHQQLHQNPFTIKFKHRTFLTLSSFTHVTNSLFSPVFTCWVFYQNTFVYFVCFTFQSPSELGEIHLSMSYYPTLDRLTIIVLRASNLKKMEPHGTGDRE